LRQSGKGGRGGGTHDTTLSVEVREDLLLEGRLVGVTGADGDGEGAGLLHSLAGDVLVDGDRGVDAAALLEEGADGPARTLGGDKDDVDVRGADDARLSRERKRCRSADCGGEGGPSYRASAKRLTSLS
jgi:hypothetical protein